MLAVATSRCHPMGATLLLVLLLAGCAPPATSALTTCQALAAARLSRNAPLAGMLAGSPDALARTLAKAAGDPVTQGPRAATDFTGRPVTRWDTGEGRVERYNDENGRFLLLRWWSKRHFTPLDGSRAESDITSVLTALGLTPDAPPVLRQQPDRLTIHVSRSYRGTQLVYYKSDLDGALQAYEMERGNEPEGLRAQITVGPFFDLSKVTTTMSSEDAKRVGLLAARCLHGAPDDAMSGSQPMFGIANETLTYVVGVGWGDECEDKRYVQMHVDAVTGAVADPGVVGSGCIQ
ncbi:hypothetical protein [Sorangium sp. So ce385]|uniref:hypothetical protein n=1 Tax=Sorangium sp. So ce385 TaxID=3133308 RepID=UPI003F5BEA59